MEGSGGLSHEDLQEVRKEWLISEAAYDPEMYPALRTISPAAMHKAALRALKPDPIEYVAVRIPRKLPVENSLALATWNMVWEAAQFRRHMFDRDELWEPMAKVAALGDVNVTFVPRTPSRYEEYGPLLHLLPKRALDSFGLPILRRGGWPFLIHTGESQYVLPADFRSRLARAWAWTVWPHLISGSKMAAFSGDDPIRLLAHNLDFWIPAVTETIQQRIRKFSDVDQGTEVELVHVTDDSAEPEAMITNPRCGGMVWFGQEDAEQAVRETVEAADRTGRLRAILDAVRSNRVEDDFSNQWSYAREDFARKLYHKRNKNKVVFVELDDTIPVHGPEAEVLGNLVTNDFLAMLDTRNRQIVILLASGVTKRSEISQILGYANHSAVSKRLAHIATAARSYFDVD